jgi:DNA-directed RNA polymerase subunit RPC12/RpoP
MICPYCDSNRVRRERIMGMKTGDYVCLNCDQIFIGSHELNRITEKKKKQKAADE